jgi:hypothetical protein
MRQNGRTVRNEARTRPTTFSFTPYIARGDHDEGHKLASWGYPSEETMQDARTVTVKLFHDAGYPSALSVPIGRPEE